MFNPDRPTRVLWDSKEAVAASLYQEINETCMFCRCYGIPLYPVAFESRRTRPSERSYPHMGCLDCVAMLLGRNNRGLPKHL